MPGSAAAVLSCSSAAGCSSSQQCEVDGLQVAAAGSTQQHVYQSRCDKTSHTDRITSFAATATPQTMATILTAHPTNSGSGADGESEGRPTSRYASMYSIGRKALGLPITNLWMAQPVISVQPMRAQSTMIMQLSKDVRWEGQHSAHRMMHMRGLRSKTQSTGVAPKQEKVVLTPTEIAKIAAVNALCLRRYGVQLQPAHARGAVGKQIASSVKDASGAMEALEEVLGAEVMPPLLRLRPRLLCSDPAFVRHRLCEASVVLGVPQEQLITKHAVLVPNLLVCVPTSLEVRIAFLQRLLQLPRAGVVRHMLLHHNLFCSSQQHMQQCHDFVVVAFGGDKERARLICVHNPRVLGSSPAKLAVEVARCNGALECVPHWHNGWRTAAPSTVARILQCSEKVHARWLFLIELGQTDGGWTTPLETSVAAWSKEFPEFESWYAARVEAEAGV